MGIITVEEDREIFYVVGETPQSTFEIPFSFRVEEEVGVQVDGVDEGGLTVVGEGEGPGETRQVTTSSPIVSATVRVYDDTRPVRRSSFAAPGVFSASAVDLEFDRVYQYLQGIAAFSVTSSNIIETLDTILGGDTWRNGYADLEAAVVAAEAAASLAQSAVGDATDAVADAEAAQTAAEVAQAAAEAAQAAAEAAGGMVPYGTTANRPNPPTTGEAYFDTDISGLIIWNGTDWIIQDEMIGQRTMATSGIFALTDTKTLVKSGSASAMDMTVPPNSSVAFPLLARIHVMWYAAGQPTIVAGAGVTVRVSETLLLNKQYSLATLLKIDTDEWVMFGYLEAA